MEKQTDANQLLETATDISYIHENLLMLRRRLTLTQEDFIGKYLSDDKGKPLLSIAKLSNLENRGNKDCVKYAAMVADKLSIDPKMLQLEPDAFARNLELLVKDQLAAPAAGGLADLAQMVQKTSYVETLVRVMCDYLTDNIISGELKPGDKLPSDRNLALMFHSGRTAVREALKVLSVLGLVRILPGQGTFIASTTSSFFLAPLSWTFLIGEHNLEHVITVRTMLEDTSSRLAAGNATEADLEDLRKVYQDSRDAFTSQNFQKFLEYDIDFHLMIAKCSHNPIIYDLLMTSRKLITHISKSGMVNLEDLNVIYQEHTRIYESILARDSRAASQNMRSHLESSYKRYKL